MKTKSIFTTIFYLITAASPHCFARAPQNAGADASPDQRSTHIVAADVFKPDQTVMFQDDFKSPEQTFQRWSISEDANYNIPKANPERLSIVDAPDLATGEKAVRFFVNRAPDSFRSKLSLPNEKGWNERWYAERIMIPKDWVTDPSMARTIVMQWHGIPGNFRATYPNLDIAIRNDHWMITRSFGDPKTKPTRDNIVLDEPVKPGAWVSWVIHAKWSPDQNGLLEI